MNVADVTFYGLGLLIIVFIVLMLFAKNFIHSAIFLAVALLGFAGLYVMLSAEFLAVMQIFIYAGAITVLILFVIMMTQTRAESWKGLFHSQSALAAPVVFILAAAFFKLGLVATMPVVTAASSNTEALAELLFDKYLFPFEIASVVLLVAMIGAIYLAKGDRR